MTRGRVCRLQLLPALANAVILGSESRGTRDDILLSQIRDFPFRRLLQLAELLWRYLTLPPHGMNSQLKVILRPTINRPVWLKWTSSFRYIAPARTAQKRLFQFCVFSRCRRNSVSTKLFISNGCLHSCYLTKSLHVYMYIYIYMCVCVCV
jgi:hypothetical protein